MQAVIMAGGFGTRLRPITCNIPKPMAPMANEPMLCHIINLLKNHSFKDLTMLLYYQPEVIQNYFKDGKGFGVNVKYLRPEGDLGTAGSVKFAQKTLTDTFLVISGDVLTDFDLTQALEFHKRKKAIATMVLTRVPNPLQFGVVITDKHGKIERFLEKPSWGEVFSDSINTGIYILEPKVLDYIPANKDFDFSKELFPLLLKEKKPLYGYIADGYWKDIGSHDEYRLAHYDILDGVVKVEVKGKKMKLGGSELIVGENPDIGKDAFIDSNVILGDNVVIGKGAKISRSVIGSNTVIGDGAEIYGSILWNHIKIGAEARLKENVIGNFTEIGDRSVIQVGTIIADECSVGKDALIKTNLRIWPSKVIADGAILASSLVWGERWDKVLFNSTGITGLANVEITPEFAAKLGAAYGAFIGEGNYIITARDTSRVSRMIKRALISGILSAGVKIGDLSDAPIPVVRYEIGNEGERGGVHVRQSPLDSKMIDIKFFNNKGRDISLKDEKNIEQLFFREDFRRADISKVGVLTVPPRALDAYRAGYLQSVNKDFIAKLNQRVIIDYAHSSASMIFPSILGELGIDALSLNAFVTSSVRVPKSSEEFQNSRIVLSDFVTKVEAAVGFLIDSGAEKLFLVDERGKILRDDLAMFVVLYMILKTNKKANAKIAVPVYASDVVDLLAKKFKVEVKRTGTSPRSIMDAAAEENVIFVGDSQGGFIFPQFQASFDAMFAIGKVLEMLSELKTSISEIEKQIPQLAVLHKAIACPADKKGQAMRNANEHAQGQKSELIDGVKIRLSNGEGWVLLVPDAADSFFHIWAEAKKPSQAKHILDAYSKKVKQWQE
ncbi:MAG: mannose-1-phosphate guanyltransferase [Elusimicrobiota bacterium]|jgi:mannose-1-phosphate guanylyltransferase/phosphomannomutase|nr:mannose-1-phosphate guanyltransferase [Elusimicrobiota bacterium]